MSDNTNNNPNIFNPYISSNVNNNTVNSSQTQNKQIPPPNMGYTQNQSNGYPQSELFENNNNVINNNKNFQNNSNSGNPNPTNYFNNNAQNNSTNSTNRNFYQNPPTSPNGSPPQNHNASNTPPYGYNPNVPPNVPPNVNYTSIPNYNYNYNQNHNNQPYMNFQNTGNQSYMNHGNTNYNIPKFKGLEKIYDKVDRIFATFSIVLGFLFIFLIGSVFFNLGIGATIFFIAALFTSYFYLYKKEIKIDTPHNITFIAMVLLSLPFTIYSNRLTLGIDFTVLTFGLLYWIYSAGEKNKNHLGGIFTEVIISCFAYPFMNFTSVFTALFKKGKTNKPGNAKWVILGLVIALPIVCLVSSLLLMGDEMFSAMFSFLFENFILHIFKYLWYAVLGLPIAMCTFSAWYTKHYEEKSKRLLSYSNDEKNNNYINLHIAPIPLMYSIAIPLCVVYFLYLISQVAYFFSFIADNLLPEGFTIVDYARRGFFELCVVTVINIIIIALLLILTKRPANVVPMGLKVITTLMSVFTMVIIGTALYKMFMYISGYGYTSMRINTSIFMIFLFVIFILLISKQFLPNVKFSTATVTIAFIFLAVYNLIDVDAFIAKENIRRFQEGEISWMGNSMVATLDDSAFEYIVPFAANEDNGLSDSENESLDSCIRARYRRFNDDEFSTFNFSSYKVKNIMEKYGYDTTETYYDTHTDYDYSNDYDGI